ncbi:MAG: amino acid ABC transporter ATP-binding protein [Spirochaetales bacterium]|nr:amino acid ABC transporter ATP-binding protein [Spirochaetales bacterium]
MNIDLKGISKSYEKPVFNNIKFKLDSYNTIAIIGKSGCGKSTLLRLMAGIESTDEGEIHINGHEVDPEGSRKNLTEYHRSIGIVFQQHNLFPHLSLLENITLILEKTRGMAAEKANNQAMNLLKRLHLEEEASKKPNFVSGGQAQRASIARALATEPELVFMDEPTASLDPILTREVLDAVLGLKSTGTKFIFVTHEIDFVRQFAEYVLFMDEGDIAEHGEVDILNTPQTKELERFLKSERS